jgi:hypothetical protein
MDDLQRRFVIAIVQIVGDDGKSVGLHDANAIAERVFSGFRRDDTSAERIAFLTGASLTEPGFKGLQVHRLQSELEELGIHDPDDDATRGDCGERRYQIRWETLFGAGLKGVFEEIVVLPPTQRDAGEEDFGGLADFGGKQVEGVDELRKKVQELEGMLRGKEKELGRFKESVLRAVVS